MNLKYIEFFIATLVAITAVGLCYYPFGDLWDSEGLVLEGKIIALVIMSILILGLLFLAFQSVQLLGAGRQIELAPRQSAHLSTAQIFRALRQTPVIGSRLIEPVHKEAKKFERIDFQNLLSIEYNHSSNRRAYVKYSIGIMITLGILGTFLGLIEAVEKSSTLLDSIGTLESEENMAQKFKAPFSGMNTAFNTSILGIIGSITLGFYNTVSARFQQHLFIELEKYFELYLMPTYYPKSESLQARSLKELGEIRKETIDLYSGIDNQVSLFLKETRKEQELIVGFTEAMQAKVDAIQQDFQKENRALAKAFEGHLKLSFREFEKENTKRQETYLKEIQSISAALDSNAETNTENINKYAMSNSSDLSNIKTDFEERLKSQQSTFNQAVKGFKEEHRKSLTKLHQDFRSELLETTKTIGLKINDQALSLEGIINDSVKKNDTHLQKLYDHTQSNADGLALAFKQRTEDYINGISERFQKVTEQIFKDIQQHQKLYSKGQNELLKQLQIDSKLLQSQSKITLDTFKEAAKEFLNKTESFQKEYAKYIERLSQSNMILDKTNTEIKVLNDGYANHSTKVSEYHEQIIQLTKDYDMNSKSLLEETQKLILSYQGMAELFEGLRSEEAKISATFNSLFELVSKHLNLSSYEENGNK